MRDIGDLAVVDRETERVAQRASCRHRQSRARREPRTDGYVGADEGVEAAELVTARDEGIDDSDDVIGPRVPRRARIEGDLDRARASRVGAERDHAVGARPHRDHGALGDEGRKDEAAAVVSVLADQIDPAVRGAVAVHLGQRYRYALPMPLRAVIKAGGSKGVDRDAVSDLVAQVARQDEIVLVHGASAETDRIASELGVPQEQIASPSGHVSRRTDRRTLEIFAMAALGVENFLYVEKLQQRGVDAVGLSGLSGRLLVGRKKDVRAVKNGKTFILRDDYTGTVEAVNLPLLTQLIGPGRVPVIAPLALSTENQALNVDGDRVAARIAVAIDADALLILTNVPGLLRDVDDPSSLVSETTLEEAETLAHGRMKKKILAAREALEAGVEEVVIRSATGDPAVRTVIRA